MCLVSLPESDSPRDLRLIRRKLDIEHAQRESKQIITASHIFLHDVCYPDFNHILISNSRTSRPHKSL